VNKTLWGGRFGADTSTLLRKLNDSLSFDRELFDVDVQGSVAWVGALEHAGVLTKIEAKRIVGGLEKLSPPPADAPDEDVHSYVERSLGDLIGPLAGKLHTGRSRNDQVATDLRLYVRGAIDDAIAMVHALASALVVRAEREAKAPMPGYTHSKRAEPITLGHFWLAHTEPLLRDLDRLSTARERMNECPLGSGALSGTPIAIDRKKLATALGFAGPCASSVDGVADRDFVVDYLSAVATLFVHLSRLGEDLIFFQTDEAGFFTLPDALATGSSRMPQKKNPDLLELCRGHAGRAIGELAGILGVLKGLPLAYDKDLQLDKEPVFRTRAVVAALLPALAALVEGLTANVDVMAAAASDERLLATALADALADRGIPFRQAHEIVGKRFRQAEEGATTMVALGAGGGVTAEDLRAVSLSQVLGRRSALGGTAPSRVLAAAKAARKRLQAWRPR
jgi:argininosuccinate lyase